MCCADLEFDLMPEVWWGLGGIIYWAGIYRRKESDFDRALLESPPRRHVLMSSASCLFLFHLFVIHKQNGEPLKYCLCVCEKRKKDLVLDIWDFIQLLNIQEMENGCLFGKDFFPYYSSTNMLYLLSFCHLWYLFFTLLSHSFGQSLKVESKLWNRFNPCVAVVVVIVVIAEIHLTDVNHNRTQIKVGFCLCASCFPNHSTDSAGFLLVLALRLQGEVLVLSCCFNSRCSHHTSFTAYSSSMEKEIITKLWSCPLKRKCLKVKLTWSLR